MTRAKDLFWLFNGVSNVVEVVVPPKQNKFGKWFGFARFIGVEDERHLAIKLDNILIDGKKIHANQPRFSKVVGKRSLETRS